MTARNTFANFEALYIPEPNSGCWLWLGPLRGPKNLKYKEASFKWHGKHKLAHRFAYEQFKGLIPPGYVVDHLCCLSSCVNPDHLEAVTFGENIRRGHARRKANTHPWGNKIRPHKRPNRRKRNGSYS